MALAATALMLFAASVAFLSNASAQDRPPAQRPVVEQAEAPPADEAVPPPREPMQRPSDQPGDAAQDAAAADAAEAAAEAAETETSMPTAPPIPVAPPGPGDFPPELDEAHQAFQECVNEMFNSLENNNPEQIDFNEIDNLIFENCVPLLPEEEQAAIIARRPYQECTQALYGNGNMPMTEDEYMAIEAAILEQCVPLLPAEEQAQILAYNAYQTCIEEALGDNQGQAAYAYAAQGCLSVLPAEIAEMEAVFINWQVCLADNGAYDNQPVYNNDTQYSIHISTPDGQITVNLGSEPSSVSIDSDGTSLTVTADGDAQVYEMNFDEHFPVKDAAYEACADLSPFPEGMPVAIPAGAPNVVVDAAEAVEDAMMPAVASFARTARANR